MGERASARRESYLMYNYPGVIDYRQANAPDLYKDAAEWSPNSSYWAAWFAARRTANALLQTAIDIGLSTKQIEALRLTAARVAYD